MNTPIGIIRDLKQLNRLHDLSENPETPFAALAQCREIRSHLPSSLLEAHDQIRLSGNKSVAAMLYRHCGVCCVVVDASVLALPRLAGLFLICPGCKTLLYEMSEGYGDMNAEGSALNGNG